MQTGRYARNALDSGKVLRGAGRLLARHWPALVALSAGGLLIREYVLDAAVGLAAHSKVGGILMVAVAPLTAMLVTVAMLLIMQRSATGRDVSGPTVIASIGSMIVPFLVVYENYGNLGEDWNSYLSGIRDAAMTEGFLRGLSGDTGQGGSWLPEGTSVLVIGIVAGALAVRSLATRLAARLSGDERSVALRRTAWQTLSAYSDVVWVVLGVAVVAEATDRMADWWSSRVVAQWLNESWERLTVEVPFIQDVADVVAPLTGHFTTGLLVGIVVPISWLTFGLIVYGTQAADVLHLNLDSDGPAGRLLRRMTTRVGTATVERAWQLSLDPELRFGPLIGGLGMIRRAAWTSALAFCLAYVVVSEAGRLVWAAARWIVGPDTFNVWTSLEPVLSAVTSIVVQVLTACLLAAAAGSLVRAFTREEAEETSSVEQPVSPPAGASSRG